MAIIVVSNCDQKMSNKGQLTQISRSRPNQIETDFLNVTSLMSSTHVKCCSFGKIYQGSKTLYQPCLQFGGKRQKPTRGPVPGSVHDPIVKRPSNSCILWQASFLWFAVLFFHCHLHKEEQKQLEELSDKFYVAGGINVLQSSLIIICVAGFSS